ncbi:PAS domain-containing sensor histidine kinase [Spirosoma flavus]
MNSPRQGDPWPNNVQLPAAVSDSQKYQALRLHMPQGYCVIEVLFDEHDLPLDYLFLEVNPLFEELTGLLDAVGKTMRQLQPAHEQHWYELYAQVVKTGQPVHVEQQAAHLAGGVWYDVLAFPLGPSHPHQVAILFQDITPRKRTQLALQVSEERFRLFVTASSDVVYTMSADWRIMNRLEGKTFLADTRQPSRDWLLAYIPLEERKRVEAAIEVAITTNSLFELEHRVIRADGKVGWTYSRAVPILDQEGQLLEWLGTAIDITERKQQEQQQAFLLRFSDTLRTQPNPDALTNRALQLLTDHLQLDRCYIAVYRLAEDRADITHQVGNERVPPMPQSIRPSDFPETFQIVFEQTLVIDDVGKTDGLTQMDRQNMSALGFSALVASTLRQGENHPLWVLVAVSAHARHWTPAEIKLIEEVTERTWTAIERARAEEALRESEKQFRTLADALPQAIWVTDPAGNVEFLNQWWADYSGIVFEPTTAWQVAQDSLHPEDGPRLVAAFQQAMQQGEGFAIEQRNRSASGEYRWFLNIGEPYQDPKTGQITKWVGVSIDIDDRKRTEQALADSENRYRGLAAELEGRVVARTQELEQANQNLTRSNANLQQFAYVASHDLQEPLRKIQQFGDLLRARHTSLAGDELVYIERMQVAASRMATLIRDLLNFSRLSTQRERDERVPLNGVIDQVLTTFDLVIAETKADVKVGPLPAVLGDASQLVQLFQNLVGNALKFHRPTVAPLIQIQAQTLPVSELPSTVKPGRAAEYYYQIDVMDNGVGFDEKYLDRIFQVFQRLHGKSEFAGTGIGLAISERVVANHGGAITASSQVGQGATFRVYLPT